MPSPSPDRICIAGIVTGI